MKRIGIDCRMWNETGIGRYVHNIVLQLAQMDTQNTYILFYYDDSFLHNNFPKNFEFVKAPIRWHTFGEQLKLPLIYLKANLDLLYVPHFNVPVLYPKKFICTIHDLTILHVKTGRATTLPYPIYWLKRVAFRLNIYSSILRSKHIFTVSNYVKSEILSTFKGLGLKSEKISLTFNAVDAKFKRIPISECTNILKKYSVSTPYLFYVGNAHPHKNIEKFIEAFKELALLHPDLHLVLGGSKDFFYTRLANELSTQEIRSKIIFIGFVADDDLPALYSASLCYVNPSLYEGFGIQILEAFACGTKVACSNTTSLPEVSGGKACYFDPTSTADMVNTITKCIESSTPDYTAVLQRYDWKNSATVIMSVIKELL